MLLKSPERYLLLLFLSLVPSKIQGQEQIKKYVQTHTVEIKSIQPEANDYADLEAIGRAIDDARVVMLGEQDHGDGVTFLAKTRLIKYLHEKKGFNVLAFEGDFFALNHGWQKVPKEDPRIKNFLSNNIYPTWAKCQQCDGLLYDYIPQTYTTNSPLIIAGFDCQMFGVLSHVALKGYVDEYLQSNQVPFTLSQTYQEFFLPFIGTLLRPQAFIKKSNYLIPDAPVNT